MSTTQLFFAILAVVVAQTGALATAFKLYLDAKVDAINLRFDSMNARFDSTNLQIDLKTDPINATLGQHDVIPQK
jgi:hypothetical protein